MVGGALDDLGDGCVPGVPGAGRHGDGEAFEVSGEGAGVALEASAPDAALDLGRGPSREGDRRRGLDRSEGLLGSRGAQRRRGLKLGRIRRARTAERDAAIVAAVEAGQSLRSVGREWGLALSTVHHVCSRVFDEPNQLAFWGRQGIGEEKRPYESRGEAAITSECPPAFVGGSRVSRAFPRSAAPPK